MRKILEEIKQQPPHIREVFMWLCVVITFSLIGFAWFRSTSEQFVALLNPDQVNGNQVGQAKPKTTTPPSPFANLFISFKDLTANIRTLFDFSGQANEVEVVRPVRPTPTPTVPAQQLPITK